MEKRKPHYDLDKIKTIVKNPASRPFTVTALRGGLEAGLTEKEMREVVLNLTREDFYKSMTARLDTRIWQDVYRGHIENDLIAYIKVTFNDDERPPVIQFKMK